ncbi:hypothetical protein [Chiayiivirga flava]|uniref:Phasin domain-containing protein n=1 Tax=Chiayiivirga flava TaxID=659595 RepID=A0A7W8FZD9_9GAMM|nr:hypothetical protein [Chiayiivirga flava]MBB5206543.1 hypothetical protein [Chiayiivirga flava]
MTAPTLNAPFALMKASFELMLRINGTVLEAQRRWLEAGARCADESIEIAETDTDQVAHADGWTRLRELPLAFGGQWIDAATRYLQRSIETAMTNQTNVLTGLQNAAAIWQDECAQALGRGATTAPLSTSLNALFAPILAGRESGDGQGAAAADAPPPAQAARAKPRARRS